MTLDNETGEYVYNLRSTLNCETGEEEYVCSDIKQPEFNQNRQTFKIPLSCYQYENPTKIRIDKQSSCISAAAILFLLPTTIFSYPILSLVLVITEITLHIWAHKTNKKLKNKNLYYQSPLHIICKEYCASCREELSKQKITKIQDKRNDRIHKYDLDAYSRIVT